MFDPLEKNIQIMQKSVSPVPSTNCQTIELCSESYWLASLFTIHSNAGLGYFVFFVQI